MVWSNYVITQENRQDITETYSRQKGEAESFKDNID